MKNHIKFIYSILLIIVCLIFKIEILALEIDIYQNMENGNPGDLLTPEIMDSSSHGGCGAVIATWDFPYGDQLWVSNEYSKDLPGVVIVDGINYNSSGTRTWRFRNREENQYVKVYFGVNEWDAPDHEKMTIACYYTTEQTDRFSNQHDNIEMGGIQTFSVLQTIGDAGDDPPYIRAHSCTEGWVTTFSPNAIKIKPGKTYWINLHHDGPAGLCKVAVFDPDSGFAQVGETVVANSVPGSKVRSRAHFGRCSPHGNYPNNDTEAYFDHIMIDFTPPVQFPLLPDSTGSGTPTPINLQPNYPNPFIERTTINYSVTQPGNVKLIIYDILGREIKVLIDEYKTVGPQSVEWDGTDAKGKRVPSGTYFYQIRGKNGEASAKKMIFLK